MVGKGSIGEINQQFKDNYWQFSPKLLQSGGSKGVYNSPTARQHSYIKSANW